MSSSYSCKLLTSLSAIDIMHLFLIKNDAEYFDFVLTVDKYEYRDNDIYYFQIPKLFDLILGCDNREFITVTQCGNLLGTFNKYHFPKLPDLYREYHMKSTSPILNLVCRIYSKELRDECFQKYKNYEDREFGLKYYNGMVEKS